MERCPLAVLALQTTVGTVGSIPPVPTRGTLTAVSVEGYHTESKANGRTFFCSVHV